MTSQDLLALIAAHADIQSLLDAGDIGGVTAALNDTSRATRSVPAAISNTTILGGLSPQSLSHIWSNPNAATIRNDILAQDGLAVIQWAGLALAGVGITLAEHDAIVAQCEAVETIPASLAEVAFGAGVVVTEFAVALARPRVKPAAPTLPTFDPITPPDVPAPDADSAVLATYASALAAYDAEMGRRAELTRITELAIEAYQAEWGGQ